MKIRHRFSLATIVALAITIASPLKTTGATNGMILISTRKSQDLSINTTDALDQKGPGQASQGDVAMAELLGDNGYSSRIVLDASLNSNIGGDPEPYLHPTDATFNATLVILSGSSGSADVPQMADKGIPVMIGEHSCIGDRAIFCSCFMYINGATSGNIVNPGAGQYMKVLASNHPILQGIPLDPQGRVKIFRDPYPEENAHVPTGGKPNYEYSWTAIDAAGAAKGTTVLGLLDSNTNKAVFAVNDIGGLLGNGTTNSVRLIHWIVNEDGSGGSRRMFNALTEIGRVIFVRTVKWALGDALQPYQGLGIIDVSQVGNASIKLSWQGSARNNYRIQGTTDLANWQTVVDDIPGTNGVVARTLNIAAGPKVAFLRIRALP